MMRKGEKEPGHAAARKVDSRGAKRKLLKEQTTGKGQRTGVIYPPGKGRN